MGEERSVIQKRYLTTGVLGHELMTVDMWLMTATVYMCKSVGTAAYLRTAKKWCVTGRIVDAELLNVDVWSPEQSNHLTLALAL